jgi:hypothetical protein
MSILEDLLVELLANRSIRVDGVEVPRRGTIEFAYGVTAQDDQPRDTTVLQFNFAPDVRVDGPNSTSHALGTAPSVDFLDGSESTIEVILPPAPVFTGRTVRIVDIGPVSRTVAVRATPGEADTIDGAEEPFSRTGLGLSLEFVALAGSDGRAPGWFLVSERRRGV